MNILVNYYHKKLKFYKVDMVYPKHKPYKMCSSAKQHNEKLTPMYFGPFHIFN